LINADSVSLNIQAGTWCLWLGGKFRNWKRPTRDRVLQISLLNDHRNPTYRDGMKAWSVGCVAILLGVFSADAQPPSPVVSHVPPDTSQVPKEYEVGDDTISPDGSFALLYPVRNDTSDDALPQNVLVRLKPYAVLKVIEGAYGPYRQGMRGAPEAMWNGNSSLVAIWNAMKWGHENLIVCEIENARVRRVQKIWPQVVKLFDRDFRQRFLRKYPNESDNYTFVSDREEKELEFRGRKLWLDIFAENKPNLAPGPHWTAELEAVWDLDKQKFAKVEFRPGEIEIRKQVP
jgi:hypothetical protein